MHKGNSLRLLQEDLLIQKFTKAQKRSLLFVFTSLLTLHVFLSKSALERKKELRHQAQTDQVLNAHQGKQKTMKDVEALKQTKKINATCLL